MLLLLTIHGAYEEESGSEAEHPRVQRLCLFEITKHILKHERQTERLVSWPDYPDILVTDMNGVTLIVLSSCMLLNRLLCYFVIVKRSANISPKLRQFQLRKLPEVDDKLKPAYHLKTLGTRHQTPGGTQSWDFATKCIFGKLDKILWTELSYKS